MKMIDGDLIEYAKDGLFDVIIHGCNCFNKMGAGIALKIKKEFPEAFLADQKTRSGTKTKLGTYTSVFIEKYQLTIINGYTQYRYGKGKHFDYEAFTELLHKIKNVFHDKRIGMNMIGCGLAGGDSKKVLNIIENIMYNCDITIVLYK